MAENTVPRDQLSCRWLSVYVFTCIVQCIISSSIQYTAPYDCKWTALNGNEVSVSCHLQTIVADGVLATNFSLIQSDHTSALTVTCDSMFFESTLASTAFSHLRYLKALQIKYCKFRNIPKLAFTGLNELRNLSIRTMNAEWGEYSLTLDPDSFIGLNQLETLDIGFNKLESVSDLTICHLNSLKSLNLTHNDLKAIISFTEGPPRKFCANDLAELDASGNLIKSISKNDIQNFKSLRVIRLAHNRISDIDPAVFSNFAKLQIIDLSFNELTTIPSLLFQDSPDVRELYFQNNSISDFPPSLLNGLQQLVILNLAANQISSDSIGPETFVDLIRLVILDLSHNKLSYINSTLFQSQYTLQMLFLSHNDISTISDNSFSSLYNLHTLDLSHNRLKYLDVFTLNGLYVISNLHLSYNSIYSIHSDAFKNCSSVQDLTLEGNNLSQVPTALRSLQFLKSLNLNNNSMHELNNQSFQELKQLRRLSVSLNRIRNLSRGIFKHVPALKSLDLSKNQIQSLESNIFDDAETLSEIDLSDNLMKNINGHFVNLKGLLKLNVSRNKIFWFDYAIIPHELHELDIHSNEIDALGNFYELEAILQLQKLDVSFNLISEINQNSFPNSIKILKMNNNRINSVNPFTFMAKSNLTFVDMSSNLIQTIDINTFRLNPSALKKPLPEFAISDNPFFCDCNMEWLQHMNKPDGANQYPRIVDMDKVMCKLSFTRHNSYLPLSKSQQ